MKEKRILIREFTISPCTGCSGAGENDCDNCYDYDTWNSCLTRAQAIEKMAIGLFKVDNVLALDIKWEQLEKSTRLTYKVFAEAALNALLEGRNDKR